MPLILFILRLLLDLLVGWWREAAPLAVRKDGRVQVWTEDDAADAAVGNIGLRLSLWRSVPLRAGGPPGRSMWGGVRRRDG